MGEIPYKFYCNNVNVQELLGPQTDISGGVKATGYPGRSIKPLGNPFAQTQGVMKIFKWERFSINFIPRGEIPLNKIYVCINLEISNFHVFIHVIIGVQILEKI